MNTFFIEFFPALLSSSNHFVLDENISSNLFLKEARLCVFMYSNVFKNTGER